MQQVLNGSVHEEASLINQPPPLQQQQPPPPPPVQQHQYIAAEPAAQTQFVKEKELDSNSEQQPQVEDEQQVQTEERTEKVETEAASIKESEPERQVPNNTVSNNGPKTYANLVKSFPSTTGATSPQTPKLPMSPVIIAPIVWHTCGLLKSTMNTSFLIFLLQPPMTSIRIDDRTPLHPANNGSTLSVSSNVSAVQQQAHRVGGNQTSQQQPHPQQQRIPRGGLVQRGKNEL